MTRRYFAVSPFLVSRDPMHRFALFAMLLLVPFASAAEPARYKIETIEGWQVHISRRLLDEHPEETKQAIEILKTQLKTVIQVVPAGPLAELKKVPLWMSAPYDKVGPTAEYHPDAGWLRDHGRNPEMAKAVEFTDVLIFEKEVKRMPVFVLHELAHAYHDRVLGFENEEIENVYRNAMKQKLYDSVKRNDGQMVKHYATTNAKEYFAECSESFFGRNDFFPFDRAEIEKHDPEVVRLLKRVWKVE